LEEVKINPYCRNAPPVRSCNYISPLAFFAIKDCCQTQKILFPRRAETIKRENIVPAPHGDDKRRKILFPRRAETIKGEKYCYRAARRR